MIAAAFRQRAELGKAIVHDMRRDLFEKIGQPADMLFQSNLPLRPHHRLTL